MGRTPILSARGLILALYWSSVPFIVTLYLISRAVPPAKVQRRKSTLRGYRILVVAPTALFLTGTAILLATFNPWILVIAVIALLAAGAALTMAAPSMLPDLKAEIRETEHQGQQ